MDITPIAVGVPAAAGAGALILLGWNRTMRRRLGRDLKKELARRHQLLVGAARLYPGSNINKRAEGRGQMSILAVGTFAARLLPFVLQEFVLSGTESCVGPIYLLELDQYEREMCINSLPPAFRSKVVVVHCPTYSVGMSGDSTKDVLAAEEYWRQDVLAGAQRWLARVQAESEPGLLLAIVSPGGSAAIGYAPARAYRERFPRNPIYEATLLDGKSPIRRRFSELRQLYSLDNLTRGFLLFDNRRFSRRSDTGLAILMAASVASTFISDQPLPPANLLALVFPKERPGGFATLSVWAETLPIFRIPPWEKSLPEVFCTKASLFEEKAIRGVHQAVERPDLQSLPLEPAGPGNTRLALVAAPIVPRPDFQASARRISEALEPWRSQADPDLCIQFASVGVSLGACLFS